MSSFRRFSLLFGENLPSPPHTHTYIHTHTHTHTYSDPLPFIRNLRESLFPRQNNARILYTKKLRRLTLSLKNGFWWTKGPLYQVSEIQSSEIYCKEKCIWVDKSPLTSEWCRNVLSAEKFRPLKFLSAKSLSSKVIQCPCISLPFCR